MDKGLGVGTCTAAPQVLMSWLPTASQAGLGQASSHVSKVKGFPIGREGAPSPPLTGTANAKEPSRRCFRGFIFLRRPE